MCKNVTVLGGDTRQLHTAACLASKGYGVKLFGFELYAGEIKQPAAKDLSDACSGDVILLGLPCTKNGKTLFSPFSEHEYDLKDIVSRIRPGAVLLAGKAPSSLNAAAEAAGGVLYDYFEREELTVKNALLTGEGVLSVLLEKLPVTVFGLRAAITGYGRVAFYTARILKSLGADVTVFARSPEQLAKAENASLKAVELNAFETAERRFDALINTVPFPIIGKDRLSVLNRDCLLIETASAPFGIDKDAAAALGFTLIKAQSLPGKTAPVTAGRIIAETADKIIREVT